jgi:predicted transcriptional regulator
LIGGLNDFGVWGIEVMTKMIIGVASRQSIRARALAIASGNHHLRSDEPTIWFTSMRSLAEVLSDDNRALLRVIREQKPESLSQLALFSGRAPSNLSRTLKAMERYGLVEMQRDLRTVRPVVRASKFVIEAA